MSGAGDRSACERQARAEIQALDVPSRIPWARCNHKWLIVRQRFSTAVGIVAVWGQFFLCCYWSQTVVTVKDVALMDKSQRQWAILNTAAPTWLLPLSCCRCRFDEFRREGGGANRGQRAKVQREKQHRVQEEGGREWRRWRELRFVGRGEKNLCC